MDRLSFGRQPSFDPQQFTPSVLSPGNFSYKGLLSESLMNRPEMRNSLQFSAFNANSRPSQIFANSPLQNSFGRAVEALDENFPSFTNAFRRPQNSYEMFKQVLDNGTLNSPNFMIKSEHTSNNIHQNVPHFQPNAFQPTHNNNAFASNFNFGDNAETLHEKLNKLSFQDSNINVSVSPMQQILMQSPNFQQNPNAFTQFPMSRIRPMVSPNAFASMKSRKMCVDDSPSQNYLMSDDGSEKSSSGRRKWNSYEDDLLRKAVSIYGEKNWKSIAVMVAGRNHVQCLQRWKKVLKPGLIKGHWTAEEDENLKSVVNAGFRNWGEVASKIKGRTAKQCRERWCCNLDPAISRAKWTKEEDEQILALQKELGNKWSTIAQKLPGRTENAIKTRAKSLLRKEEKKWTTEEDEIIIKLKTSQKKSAGEEVDPIGFSRANAWAKIADSLPGRSKNAVKKRWKELKEKMISGQQQPQMLQC